MGGACRPYLARAMAARSSSLPIFERPRMSRRAASSFNSLRVFASPLRTLFASLPSAVLVLPERYFRVFLRFALACAFFTLRRAAARCFSEAMRIELPGLGADHARVCAPHHDQARLHPLQ